MNKKSTSFRNYKYNIDLEEFFKTAKNNELAVETILIGYIPKDFDTRRYAGIKTYFYNVKFMGKNGRVLKLNLEQMLIIKKIGKN